MNILQSKSWTSSPTAKHALPVDLSGENIDKYRLLSMPAPPKGKKIYIKYDPVEEDKLLKELGEFLNLLTCEPHNFWLYLSSCIILLFLLSLLDVGYSENYYTATKPRLEARKAKALATNNTQMFKRTVELERSLEEMGTHKLLYNHYVTNAESGINDQFRDSYQLEQRRIKLEKIKSSKVNKLLSLPLKTITILSRIYKYFKTLQYTPTMKELTRNVAVSLFAGALTASNPRFDINSKIAPGTYIGLLGMLYVRGMPKSNKAKVGLLPETSMENIELNRQIQEDRAYVNMYSLNTAVALTLFYGISSVVGSYVLIDGVAQQMATGRKINIALG